MSVPAANLGPIISLTVPLALGILAPGFIIALRRAQKQNKAAKALEAAHPQQPWSARADWAQGFAESTRKSTTVMAWVLCALWNVVSVPLGVMGYRIWRDQAIPNYKVLFVLLFPAVGIGMLIWAVRETLRWAEFGKTSLILSSVPGVIGGRLSGNISARLPRDVEHGVRLRLSCINRVVTGSGKDRSIWYKILWQEEQEVSAVQVMPTPEGNFIPVQFEIPPDAIATDNTNPNDSILWRLEACASVPGVDYSDSFEVPVFHTANTPAAVAPDKKSAFASVPPGPAAKPADSKITVQTTPGGGQQFNFAAARNPGVAFGATMFFLFWTAVVAFLWSHAPFVFTLFFGAFDPIDAADGDESVVWNFFGDH